MAGNAAQAGVSVTSRAMAVLGAFDHDHRELVLSDIARRSGLSLTTTHRIVGDLVAWGALSRRDRGDYVVGRRMWDLGLLAVVQTGLREVASPFLQDLFGATLATIHLAVRDGTKVLYVDCLSGHASVPVVSQVGARLPMHATGVGKVLLAYAPIQVRFQVLSRLTRITPYTVTIPARLNEQLDRVVRDGFAQTNEEMTLGACSVAVPIFHRRGEVVAALGVVVPNLRRDRPRLIAGLQVAAGGIGRSLPYPYSHESIPLSRRIE
jgi:DNA-binding IclR family transcriptional regulator